MSDPSFNAAVLELSATNSEIAERLEALRQALPQPPVMELRRDQFEAQTAAERMAFCKRGGRLREF